MRWIRVTRCDNIPPREGRAVRLAGREIAIFNLGPSTEFGPSTGLGAGAESDAGIPHAEGSISFGVRVVSHPEYVVTVETVDKVSANVPEAAVLARVEARQLAFAERLTRLADRKSAAAEGTPALLSQIEKCEEWLAQRPDDAELALA